MKKIKTETFVWIIIACIGLVLFTTGLEIIYARAASYKNVVDTVGTITAIVSDRDSNRVYVSYNVDGKEYESILNAYSSSFYEGKEIKIYYDKTSPKRIGMKSIDTVTTLIFPGIGLIILGIVVAKISREIKRKNKKKNLKKYGELIYADYYETELKSNYQVNGRSPYNIICQWNNPADNKKYIFKSENIWINPEPIIEEKNITQFPVYISKNRKKYVVDIESITKAIVDLRDEA